MKIVETALPGVLLLEPARFGDSRGFFMELYRSSRYAEAGIAAPFVQDNFSRSSRGTLRGLHFQEPNPQGKLVQCLAGHIWDVAVDIRRGSPTFGRWVSADLDGESMRQLWVPPGFAHGFCVVSERADVLYKVTDFWAPSSERSIAWNDPALAIPWPVAEPLLSAKDAAAPTLAASPVLPA